MLEKINSYYVEYKNNLYSGNRRLLLKYVTKASLDKIGQQENITEETTITFMNNCYSIPDILLHQYNWFSREVPASNLFRWLL